MCGGNSASTDRRETLKSYGNLNDTYSALRDYGKNLSTTGGGLITSGTADTGKASKYYSDILSGDPTKVMAAAAPEVNAVTKQADQQKKEIANFGNRTGGTNQTTQNLTSDTRGKIADVISRKREGAATGLTRIGAEETGAGISLEGGGVNATSNAGSIASSAGNLSASSRQTSQQIHDAAVQQWADAVATVLMFA